MCIFYPVSLPARSRRPRAAALGEASRRRQVTQKLASFVAFVVHASLRSFPTSEQGLLALTKSPVTPPLCPRYPGVPFVIKAELPKDGFGEAFVDESDGSGFRLLSPDRQRWYQQNDWGRTVAAVDAGYPRAGINFCF
jgi:hypothetical protein